MKCPGVQGQLRCRLHKAGQLGLRRFANASRRRLTCPQAHCLPNPELYSGCQDTDSGRTSNLGIARCKLLPPPIAYPASGRRSSDVVANILSNETFFAVGSPTKLYPSCFAATNLAIALTVRKLS